MAEIRLSAFRCRVTPRGVKTFIVCKFHLKQCVRTTLEHFGEIFVKTERLRVLKHLRQFSSGINPNIEKYKLRDEMTLNELWEKFLANHAEIYTCSSALKDTKRIYAKHFSK